MVINLLRQRSPMKVCLKQRITISTSIDLYTQYITEELKLEIKLNGVPDELSYYLSTESTLMYRSQLRFGANQHSFRVLWQETVSNTRPDP